MRIAKVMMTTAMIVLVIALTGCMRADKEIQTTQGGSSSIQSEEASGYAEADQTAQEEDGNADQDVQTEEPQESMGTYDEENQSMAEDDEHMLPQGSDDIWSGTYVSDSDESVTFTEANEGTIHFSFAVSGISGNAQVNGNQAVYHGDDQHVMVFDAIDGCIQISVLSEEDYDAANSPLNGNYFRQ